MKEVALPLLLTGDEAAEVSPRSAEPLFLRLGGDDVHLGLCVFLVLRSELPPHGSEVVKQLDIKSERSDLFVSCDEASGGCDVQLH